MIILQTIQKIGEWIKAKIKWILVVSGVVGIALAMGTLNDSTPEETLETSVVVVETLENPIVVEETSETSAVAEETLENLVVVTGALNGSTSGATIGNPVDIRMVKNQIAAIQIAVSDINEIIVKYGRAILTDKRGNVKIDFTAIQKQALLDEYTVRKQILINAVNALW